MTLEMRAPRPDDAQAVARVSPRPVDPAPRRRGIGLALLRLCFERLSERAGMRVVWGAMVCEKTIR
jgi:predicted N-acetyltransferase YhbS